MDHLTFETTEQDFEGQVLNSALPVLIEFTADWCPPCQMLAPVIHQIARTYAGKLRVGVLDSDSSPTLVRQYAVMGIPTLLLFVDGQPVERIVGFKAREKIEARLRPHLAVENA